MKEERRLLKNYEELEGSELEGSGNNDNSIVAIKMEVEEIPSSNSL